MSALTTTQELEVEAFLKGESKLVSQEPRTVTWHAAKDAAEPGAYFVFDTFNDEAAREAHMNGEAGQEFVANAERLFSEAKIHRLHTAKDFPPCEFICLS
jgi:quinol monooxygenase YgiN